MISKKGDFRDLYEFKVSLSGNEITGLVMDLKIFQDMFIPFYTGKIEMFDPINLVDSIKIGDLVKIKMQTKQGFGETDGEFEKTMEVYNISGRTSDKDRSQGYTLHIASIQLRKETENRIIQTFKNKEPHKIIMECLSKIGSTITRYVIEPPTNTISYVANNISPLSAANMALRYTTPNPDYFLVPDKLDTNGSNTYALISLDDLIKTEKPKLTFNQDYANTSENRYSNQNLQIRTPNIRQLDDLSNRLIGYNANTLNTIDVNERQWDKKGKTFVGDTLPTTSMVFQPIIKETFDTGVGLTESAKIWAQARKNALFKVIQFPVMFSTFGFCKAWDLFSKTVYLDISHHDINKRSPSVNQEFMRKPFLVTAVTHHVNHRLEYRTSFRCISWDMKHNLK